LEFDQLLKYNKDEDLKANLYEEENIMKNNTSLLLLFVFCFLFLVYSGEGIAGTFQDVKRRGKLIAGVKTEYPPLGFLDNKGVNKGFDIDIAKILAKELFGNEEAVEFVPVTPENQIAFLTSMKIDIIVGLGITEERKRKIDFSIPYFISGQSILVRGESEITKYQDLARKRVATIRGSKGDSAIGELVPTAVRIKFEHPSEAVQALKEHRVEAFVEDYISIYNLLQKNRGLRIAGLEPFSPAPHSLGVRKGNKEWLDFINSTLEEMKRTGEYERLLDKWFGPQARALWRLFKK
jgi:polar amino acid transport system substrate-binding protein